MYRKERSESISETEVKRLLVESDESMERKRLLLVLDYLDGMDVDELSGRYNVERTTAQYWLDRFAYDSPENALAK